MIRLATSPARSDDGQAAPPPSPHYSLCLYVTESAANSVRAIANVRRICEEYLAGRYDLEVVNVAQCPELTRENQIIATPTLIRVSPLPSRRVIGDLSQIDRVVHGIGLSFASAIASPTSRR